MNRSLVTVALVALIGFVDSAYLTYAHYLNAIVPCSVTHGCETVLHSQYSMIGPIPLALFGVLFYLTIGFLALYVATATRISARHLFFLRVVGISGALMSIVFESVQIFVIHAICQYCALSALCTFVICGLILTIRATKHA